MYRSLKVQKSYKYIYIYIYMDIWIFTKNEKESKILIRTIRIFSQDIGMEFWD